MNERVKELAEQAKVYSKEFNLQHEVFQQKFAELIVRECMKVAATQRNPANLNYKPSERFVEDLKLHFGIEE